MNRNMFRRVETCFPIENKKLHHRIRNDLDLYLKDNCQAWLLQLDGHYEPLSPGPDEEPVQAQTELLLSLQNQGTF